MGANSRDSRCEKRRRRGKIGRERKRERERDDRMPKRVAGGMRRAYAQCRCLATVKFKSVEI